MVVNVAYRDGNLVIAAGNKTAMIALGMLVEADIVRDSDLANLVLAWPALMDRLAKLGVTKILLGRPDASGNLPAAAWAILTPKADKELEEARQQALKVAAESGIEIDAGVRVIESVDELATALGINQAESGGSKAKKRNPFG